MARTKPKRAGKSDTGATAGQQAGFEGAREQEARAEEQGREENEDVELESLEDVVAIGEESDLGELLCDMIVLDLDAIESYSAAIDRVDDESICAKLSEFRGDHERHVNDLSELVQGMGFTAPEAPAVNREVAKVAMIMGKMGGDRGILTSLKAMEDQTNFAYDHALQHPELEDEVRSVLELNLSDERRHRDWIVEQLAQP
jgi:uncharacterized protein (TIGR02284 family)